MDTPQLTPSALPPQIESLLAQLGKSERVDAFALAAIVGAASADGVASVHDIAVGYRNDYLRALRAEGKDAEREAGRLGLDEVSDYLLTSVLPRLSDAGLILPVKPAAELYETPVKIVPSIWTQMAPLRERVAEAAFKTGEYSRFQLGRAATPAPVGGSVLEAEGLTKV